MEEINGLERPIVTKFPFLDIDHILNRISERSSPDKPVFVGIGGVSAAGKSTLASFLSKVLPEAQVFGIDSYLSEGLWDPSKIYNHEPPNPSKPYIGGISPDIWDFDLIRKHLNLLEQNLPISMPMFDETIKDRVGYKEFEPSRIILLEGGHSFGDYLRDISAYRILVKATFHDCLMRKIIRTHSEYKRDDIDEVIYRYLTKDEPVRQIYEEEHSAIADQIVNNPATPIADYNALPATSRTLVKGAYRALNPKSEYGSLCEGEAVGLIQEGAGFRFYYAINNKVLVDLPISRESVEQFSLYYVIE